MANDLIRYDVLAQDALRGVMRTVMSEVAQTGLPGDHHFFITFDTRCPGVRISSRLAAQYPEEMTVVMQHQFWDLAVSDSAFEIGLSFNGVPEHLVVPFKAVTAFVDPHASFGLKFDAEAAGEDAAPGEGEADETQGADTGREPDISGAVADDAVIANDSETAGKTGTGAQIVSLDSFRNKNG